MGLADDKTLRALTDDGAFRVVTIASTQTASRVLELQGVSGRVARLLADLMTGTILVRETMAPMYRVQGILHGAERRGSLIADAHPDGTTRGLANPSTSTPFALGPGALLQMMRSLPRGGVQQGFVDVSDADDISGALMSYMQESEQVVTVTKVAAIVAGTSVAAAGGYMVQLLPDAPRGTHMIMTERLAHFPSLEAILASGEFTPRMLMDELLLGIPFSVVDESKLGFGCSCSETRVVQTLATLGREDVLALVGKGELIEMECEYCRHAYQIPAEALRALVDAS
jgi:molecular chaperone Hsp33